MKMSLYKLVIYLKKLVIFFFRPDDAISHLTVCNNFLVMAMTNGVIMRLDLEHADEPDSKFVSFNPIRIYLECECRIEKSVLRITIWHHEAC